jgi:outer membrane protein TolC
MIKKCIFLILLSFGLQNNISNAQVQESMMTDVSYVFLEKLIATAKENYPRMDAYRSKTVIAQNNLTVQKSNWLDGLSFSYVYAPNNTLNLITQPGANNSFFNGYQLAARLSLATFFQRGGAVRQAKEEIKLVKHDEEEYILTLEAEVKSRYFNYVEQLISLRLQNKAYADAQSLNAAVNNRYSKGEATLNDYLQAQLALTSAAQAKITAESNFMRSKALLEELLTKKLEEVQ